MSKFLLTFFVLYLFMVSPYVLFAESCNTHVQSLYGTNNNNANERDERALQTKLIGCEKNNYEDCNSAGVMYEGGWGIAIDYNKARELFTKSCNGGNKTGCIKLADMYRYGLGVEQDFAKAKAISDMAYKEDEQVNYDLYYNRNNVAYKTSNTLPPYDNNNYLQWSPTKGIDGNRITNNFLTRVNNSTNYAIKNTDMISKGLGLPTGQYNAFADMVNRFSSFGKSGGFNFIRAPK